MQHVVFYELIACPRAGAGNVGGSVGSFSVPGSFQWTQRPQACKTKTISVNLKLEVTGNPFPFLKKLLLWDVKWHKGPA